jgi:hypothetical protein
MTVENTKLVEKKEKSSHDKFKKVYEQLRKLVEEKPYTFFNDFLTEKYPGKNFQPLIKEFASLLEKNVFVFVEYYALCQYMDMEKNNNWSSAGKDRVVSSFLRVIMNCSSDDSELVNHNLYDKFIERKQELIEIYKINELSPEKLADFLRNPYFYFLDEKISFTQGEYLNKLFYAIGSKKRIIMGSGSGVTSMIFGIANSFRYNHFDAHIFTKEEIRTPSAVLYIVGFIDKNQIAIRREVSEYIFQNKWLSVIENEEANFMSTFLDEEYIIAEELKMKAVEYFQQKDNTDVLKRKNEFIDMMTENYLYHEISHDLVEEQNLTEEEASLVEGLGVMGENIISIMNEVLTEWMPNNLDSKGPIKNIIDIAFLKSNKQKALSMLFMYLSDAWFLDTDTKFMYPYTYIMFLTIFKYFEQDDFDFATLYNDFSDIFEFLMKQYRDLLGKIIIKLKSMNYISSKKQKTFQEFYDSVVILQTVVKELKNTNEKMTEKNFLNNIWINVFSQMRSVYPDNFETLTKYLEEIKEELYQKLVNKFCDKDTWTNFNGNINNIILAKMKEAGFIENS